MFIQKEKDVWLSVKIIPNSDKSEIIGWFNEDLKMRIPAVPEKGRANKELISFLAKVIGVPKSYIEVIQGITNQKKVLIIKNITKKFISKKLNIQ